LVASAAFYRAPLRSLAGKLTLAFLLVGLLGALLVAVLLGVGTRSAFDRFLSERDQALLVETLADYYAARGSWQGVELTLRENTQLDGVLRQIVLTDASGVVVLGDLDDPVGQAKVERGDETRTTVTVAGEVVGVVYFDAPRRRPLPDSAYLGPPPPPRGDFLDRVTEAALLSAPCALTVATEALARGQVPPRVEVEGHDELGVLARAFNQMSADLLRARELRQQMTADLAHDLRTPLSILRGYTEGLQDGRLQGTPAVFAVMHDEVEQLARLIEDLRVLSLADAGELSLHKRRVAPRALLERTALAYMVEAEQHGIVLPVEADTTLPSVLLDTDRFSQVLNNLVSNALRYTEHGAITLGAHQVGTNVQFSVRDTGSGIAPGELPLLFDRFYRGDKARQRTDGGSSGLGLAITKALVETHGGTISVQSQLGEGTTFTITIPQAS
jgi:two-component system, OmpR family, sensor histidine kinase BaeS